MRTWLFEPVEIHELFLRKLRYPRHDKEVLPKEPDQGKSDALATVMIRISANYYGDYDMALLMLTELRAGMSESDRF
jgi:hypothetical protein